MRVTASAAARAAVAAEKIRLHHYAALLIAELAFILVYPFFSGGSREGLFRALASIVFATAFSRFFGPRGRLTVVAFLLGLPAILLLSLNAFGYLERWHWFGFALGFSFLIFMGAVFVYTILSEASVTTDTLAGAISAYMLIGITFGVGYALIESLFLALSRTLEPPNS